MARPGPAIQVKLEGLAGLQNRLARVQARARNPETLAAGLAAMMEAQVKRRIQDEKTDPEGQPWVEWSAEYAASRKGNHSLLMFEGHLRDSIAGESDRKSATVGSSQIYAGVHQFGYGGVPARPYLGLSPDNVKEIDALVTDWLAGALD